MKKIVLGTLLVAIAGSTGALAQGAATGAATGAVGGAVVGGRLAPRLALPLAQSPAALLTTPVRAFALT